MSEQYRIYSERQKQRELKAEQDHGLSQILMVAVCNCFVSTRTYNFIIDADIKSTADLREVLAAMSPKSKTYVELLGLLYALDYEDEMMFAVTPSH